MLKDDIQRAHLHNIICGTLAFTGPIEIPDLVSRVRNVGPDERMVQAAVEHMLDYGELKLDKLKRLVTH